MKGDAPSIANCELRIRESPLLECHSTVRSREIASYNDGRRAREDLVTRRTQLGCTGYAHPSKASLRSSTPSSSLSNEWVRVKEAVSVVSDNALELSPL